MTKREAAKDASLMVSQWIGCLLNGETLATYDFNEKHRTALLKIQGEMYRRGTYLLYPDGDAPGMKAAGAMGLAQMKGEGE